MATPALMYALIGPAPICMLAAFVVLGLVYLIARRNEAFYTDHKYPQDDADFVQARAFKAKCSVALWASEAFLVGLLATTIFPAATALTVVALAALFTAMSIYRNWPNLQSES